jgi:hypothetical protein
MRTPSTTLLRAAAVGALVASVGIGAAQGAGASGSGSTCPSDRLCLYFNSGLGGARADLSRTDGALNNELFSDGPAGANGWNVVVGNNAASVWNRTGRDDVILFDRTGCQFGDPGQQVWLGRGESTNLDRTGLNLKNRVSSVLIPGSGNSGCVNIDQSAA